MRLKVGQQTHSLDGEALDHLAVFSIGWNSSIAAPTPGLVLDCLRFIRNCHIVNINFEVRI